jgi:hypothetical protein
MRKIKEFTLFIFILTANLQILNAASQDGGLPGYFLNLGLGSRALSMGRSFVAVSDDSSGVYWNPAGLVRIKQKEVSATHVVLFEDTRYDSIGFAGQKNDKLFYGLSAIQLSSDKIIKRDSSNIVTGEISDRDTALLLACAYSVFEEASVGAGMKIVNMSFDDVNATWAGFDMAVMLMPTKELSLGINLQNLIKINFQKVDNRDYSVPFNMKFGAAYKMLDNKLILTADVDNNMLSKSMKLHAGVEYWLMNMVKLRGGYDNGDLTVGLGFIISNYQVDYAMLNHYLGMSHRVSFTYRFGNGTSRENVTVTKEPVKQVKKYDVNVNIMKEIPTAIYHLLKKKNVSVVKVNITNNTRKEEKFRIFYHLGYAVDDEVKEVVVQKNESVNVDIVPALTQDQIKKVEVVPTPDQLYITVGKVDKNGRLESVFMNSYQAILLPYDQFVPVITDAGGKVINLIDTLATWVTFNDRKLGEVINKASDRGNTLQPPVKIVGFQPPHLFSKPFQDNRTLDERDKDYLVQIKLIYDVLRDSYQITYINQPVVYKQSQRIKLPVSTLQNKGNCVELAVLFASLLESIEIEPILVLSDEDGHAAVGWKVPGSTGQEPEKYHLLETNVFGDEFDKVLSKGDNLVAEYGLTQEFATKIPFDDTGVYKKDANILVFDVKKLRNRIPPSPYILR